MYYSVGWTCWTSGGGGGDTLGATLFAGGDALDALGTLLAGGAGDDAMCTALYAGGDARCSVYGRRRDEHQVSPEGFEEIEVED